MTDDDIEALAKKHIAPHADRLDAIMANPVPYQQTEQFRRVKALIADVLSKLRAPVADERDRHATISAVFSRCSLIPGATFWNAAEFMYDEMHHRAAMPRDPIADEEAFQAWADRFPEISDLGRLRDAWRAALASAPASEDGLTAKQAWWAGYRAGKGLPPDTPRQDAVKVDISSARLVTHWPNGTPRDERDTASDPEGKLIHDPTEPLLAASAPVADAAPEYFYSDDGKTVTMTNAARAPGYWTSAPVAGEAQPVIHQHGFAADNQRLRTINESLDKQLEEVMTERDEYHDMADKLANAIADHLLVEIGEHSSSNCPWMRALDAIQDAAPQASEAAHKEAAAMAGSFGAPDMADALDPVAESRASEAVTCDVEAAAEKMAECMDYPWAEMPEQGRAHMRKFAQSVVDVALSAQPGAQKKGGSDA